MKAKNLPMFLKLAPLAALALISAAVIVLFGGDDGRVSADEGHSGLNFSIGVDTNGDTVDNCSTFSGTTNCSLALNAIFRVKVYLKSLPSGIADYDGFDIQLNYSNVNLLYQPSDGTNPSPDAGGSPAVAGNWPGCVFEASGTGTGTVIWGCSIGISAPASTYVNNRIGTSDFQCPATNAFATVTLVHGAAGSTSLVDHTQIKHSEGAGGVTAAPESLTITCGTPPTNTPTNTNTPTKTNTPTVTSTPTNSPTPTISPTPSNTPTATPLPSDQADVTITKTDSPDPVAAGGIITYSLVVKNLGQQTATGIIASDFLPGVVTFISANSSGANCVHNGVNPGGQVDCTGFAPMAQNQQVKIVIQVTAHSPVADEHITNFAGVFAGNEPFFNQGNNNEYEQTVVLSPRPDLTLTKIDMADPIDSGNSLTYSLTVDNNGPEPALDVSIKDNLPAGAVYNDAGSSVECDAGAGPDPDVGTIDVVCNLGTVAGQATVQIAVTAPVVTQDTIIANLAYVTSSNELFSQTGNNLDGEFTAILAPPPDIAVEKTGPASVWRTAYFAYTLTVSNIGGGDAFNVQVSDTLPTHTIDNGINPLQPMTLQSVVGATCSPAVNQIFTCTIPTVTANGGQVVLTVNVRAPTTLTLISLDNNVTVSDPDEPGDIPGNNSDVVSTTIEDCFDVTGDGLMRLNDILAEEQHYFDEPPDPNYDLLYDYDGSLKITLSDILGAVNHYFDDCV